MCGRGTAVLCRGVRIKLSYACVCAGGWGGESAARVSPVLHRIPRRRAGRPGTEHSMVKPENDGFGPSKILSTLDTDSGREISAICHGAGVYDMVILLQNPTTTKSLEYWEWADSRL